MRAGIGRALKFLALALALGGVAFIPARSALLDNGPSIGPAVAGPSGAADPGRSHTGPVVSGPVQQTGPARTGLQCTRSLNGAGTDIGVSTNNIRLASTMVLTGAGSSFLSASPTAMNAVIRSVSQVGGICGRLPTLTLVDDKWERPTGLQDIKIFIKEGYFALPVVPSSEGLTAAIESGDIERAGIPVVGSDGMLRQQYDTGLSHWVYPVATATVSTMRVMAKYGYSKGARCFGIVYDSRYKFGAEGADAYRTYVKSLPGARMCADVGIYPQRASYSSEINQFNTACAHKCDMVAMLLEPQTALTWVAGNPQFGTIITSGAQTLFNEQFASNCKAACAGMLVWTGYNPPIGNLAGLPDVAEYVREMHKNDPTIDVTNQFLEGAYLGMKVFMEAVRLCGPNLTRARLQQVLESHAFKSDIVGNALRWSRTEKHANRSAQAFSISVAQGAFAGFKNEQTGFIPDPALG